MNDAEFLDLAEKLLLSVEASCDRINEESDVDLDNQRVGGMLTLIFASGSQIVINLQKPLHEVWLAAKSGGYHFRWTGSAWTDTKGLGEFFQRLSRCASEQAQADLQFVSS